MKRIRSLFLSLFLALTLFSCQSQEASGSTSPSETSFSETSFSSEPSSEAEEAYEKDEEGFYLLPEETFAYQEDPSDTKKRSKAIIHDAVEGQPLYSQMRLYLGGKRIPVYETKTNFSQIWNAEAPNRIPNAVASFGLEGKAELKLQLNFNSERHLKISPLAKNVPFSYDKAKRVINFTIESAGQYTVELTNDRVLHLFVNGLSAYENPFSEAMVFDSGIHNKANDSRINGNNEIWLSSNQKVYLAPDAFIEGKFIANNADNIQIAGPGYIDGAPFERNANTGKVLVPLEFNYCRNLAFRDFAVLDPAGWCFNMYFCSDFQIENCKIISSRSNGDGISLQSCQRAKVKNCFVRSWDDSLVVKNYPKWSDRSQEGASDDIEFSGCLLWTDLAQSMEIGYECVGEKMENIVFSDITVLHNFHKPVFSIHNGNNANVKNVLYRNITVEDASMGKGDGNNTLVELCNVYSSTWSSQHKTTSLGSIEGVKFENIKILNGKAGPAVKLNGCIDPRSGYSKDPHIVKEVKFQDFELYGELLAAEYQNYSSSYAEDISFSSSGNPITGHVFEAVDVSSYGNNIDLQP